MEKYRLPKTFHVTRTTGSLWQKSWKKKLNNGFFEFILTLLLMTPSSIIIILPYFGPLPSTFGPWLRSAELNTSVDFLIVTDQEVVSESPNITIRKTTLQQLRSLTMVKLDTYVALEKPYKLCDLRPFYGKIFSDDVNGHDFWGYCDCDMVFGDMRVFLTEDILSTHNSILSLGHLHLQRRNCRA